MKKALFFALCGMCITSGYAQKQYSLTSPDGNLKTTIMTGDTLSYDILYKDVQVMHRSPAYVTLENGDVWGIKSKVRKVKEREEGIVTVVVTAVVVFVVALSYLLSYL